MSRYQVTDYGRNTIIRDEKMWKITWIINTNPNCTRDDIVAALEAQAAAYSDRPHAGAEMNIEIAATIDELLLTAVMCKYICEVRRRRRKKHCL